MNIFKCLLNRTRFDGFGKPVVPDAHFEPDEGSHPTRHLPGTREKVELMRQRLELGQGGTRMIV